MTLGAILIGIGLASSGVMPVLAAAHVVFAVGIVPLIFAAMIHFIPVLTRTGDPASPIGHLPNAVQLAGVPVGFAMAGLAPYFLIHLAAFIDVTCGIVLLGWIVRRSRATLGSPHPGWRWYAAALICLLVALLGILMASFVPGAWAELRRLHLHLNLFGFVGLAALGTLPVLLPTAVNAPDTLAAPWLRHRLPPTFLCVAGITLGSVFSPSLSALGGLGLFWLGMSLLFRWWQCFGARILRDGIACSLAAAPVGLLMILIVGGLHGYGVLPVSSIQMLLAWFAAFLLPLVTGALGQLVPVWRMKGRLSVERTEMRSLLAWGGQLRAALFLLAGLALLVGLEGLAALVVSVGLAHFILNLFRAMRVPRSTR